MIPRKRTQAVSICIALAAMTVCAAARADLALTAVGDPVDVGSWKQAFSVYSPDTSFEILGLVFKWPSSDPESGFKHPAWDFSIDGYENPYEFEHLFTLGSVLTVASGDSTNGLLWESHFRGEREDQEFDLTLFAFNHSPWDGSFQRAVAHWDGTAWDFTTTYGGVTWDEYVAMGGTGEGVSAVPVPSAAMLGVIGFAVVGLFRRWVTA